MAKARPGKTFTRKDCVASEEDFEEALKQAMAASMASPQKHAARQPARSRSRGQLPEAAQLNQALSGQVSQGHEGRVDRVEDVYNRSAAAAQKEALESWVLERIAILAEKPTDDEQRLSSIVAEVMLQKAEASGKLMASQVGLALQQSALLSCAQAPVHRCLANLLIGSCLRNDSPLEDLQAGKDSPPGTLDAARFTGIELQKLHRHCSVNLSVIMLSRSKLRAMSLADMPGMDSTAIKNMGAFSDRQSGSGEVMDAALSETTNDWTVSELACWVRCAAVHALGSADGWDVESRTGRLCDSSDHGQASDSSIAASPDLPLMQPKLKNQQDVEDDDIRGTHRAWQIMRLIFLNTKFLCVTRSRALPARSRRLNDDEMHSMMVEACSNMEVILERWHSVGTSIFDKWLDDASVLYAPPATTRNG